MIKEAIVKVVQGIDLCEDEMMTAIEEIMQGETTPAQIGALLTGLRMKGETVQEITGAARALRAKAIRIKAGNHLVNVDREEINVDDETILDTAGTGGDGTNTFNVSTTVAFVAAGGGIKVAKHGNRAFSSLCGSATVVQELGVKLDISPREVERCIAEVGIGFLYAPLYHGSTRHAAGIRQEIGIRTLFNLLGPLTNPAGATVQVLGVYHPALTEKLARVLRELGTKEAFVVCGEGPVDEISICGPTRVRHLKHGELASYDITPEEFGLRRAYPDEIRGGAAAENARIVREVLGGAPGARRDMVLLNSAAAFVVAGLASSLAEGIDRAAASIDSGQALRKLEALVEFTSSCGVADSGAHAAGGCGHDPA